MCTDATTQSFTAVYTATESIHLAYLLIENFIPLRRVNISSRLVYGSILSALSRKNSLKNSSSTREFRDVVTFRGFARAFLSYKIFMGLGRRRKFAETYLISSRSAAAIEPYPSRPWLCIHVYSRAGAPIERLSLDNWTSYAYRAELVDSPDGRNYNSRENW